MKNMLKKYPKSLVSAINGLLSDYDIYYIITELFKQDTNSELNNKLNFLINYYSHEIVSNLLFDVSEGNNNNEVNIENIDYDKKNDINKYINVSKSNKNINCGDNNNCKNYNNDNNNGDKKLNDISDNNSFNFIGHKIKRERNIGIDILLKKECNIYKYIQETNTQEKTNNIDNDKDKNINNNNNIDIDNNKDTNSDSENSYMRNIGKDKYDFNGFFHDPNNDDENFYFKGKRENGLKTGFGTYKNILTYEYFEGIWDHNNLNGFGLYVNFEKNLFYEGYFHKEKFNGFGRLVIKEKNLYNEYLGEFKNDKKCGYGVYYFNKNYNNYYEGEFLNDKKEGIGISIIENKFRYECEYKKDTENGIGKLVYNDGDIYEGEVLIGKLEGFGIHYHNKKDKYIHNIYKGFFKKGKPKYGFIIDGSNNKYFADFSGLAIKKVYKTLMNNEDV